MVFKVRELGIAIGTRRVKLETQFFNGTPLLFNKKAHQNTIKENTKRFQCKFNVN